MHISSPQAHTSSHHHKHIHHHINTCTHITTTTHTTTHMHQTMRKRAITSHHHITVLHHNDLTLRRHTHTHTLNTHVYPHITHIHTNHTHIQLTQGHWYFHKGSVGAEYPRFTHLLGICCSANPTYGSHRSGVVYVCKCAASVHAPKAKPLSLQTGYRYLNVSAKLCSSDATVVGFAAVDESEMIDILKIADLISKGLRIYTNRNHLSIHLPLIHKSVSPSYIIRDF